jgi:hypothetical protein
VEPAAVELLDVEEVGPQAYHDERLSASTDEEEFDSMSETDDSDSMSEDDAGADEGDDTGDGEVENAVAV